MIPELLYRRIEPLDRERHRALRARALSDWSPARAMNALFVTAAEFAEACKEYPIVFVRAGKDAASGREQIAPVALTGLRQGENLYLRADGAWDARYIPAFLRRYPFAYGNERDGTPVLGLLQDMRFDATSPSGEQIVLDGFLALDTKKFAELPDAQVAELHRNGILGLLYLQQASLGNMQRLVERRIAAASI